MKKNSTFTYTVEDRNWASLIRSMYKVCVLCGRRDHLQAHHWFRPRSNAALRTCPLNGVALCPTCHRHRMHSDHVQGRDLIRIAMTVALKNRFKSVETLVSRLEDIVESFCASRA